MLILFILELFIERFIKEDEVIKKRKRLQNSAAKCYYYGILSIYYYNLDSILKSIIKRQIPFLIGGTITGIIMKYHYGFLFTLIVNSVIWYAISYLVSR